MSKEAMKLAIEALEMIDYDDNDRDFLFPSQCYQLDKAITALREALVKQPAQQEPDWYHFVRHGEDCFVPYEGQAPVDATRLYTSPPAQRKPLTLGQKQRLWSSVGDKPTLKDRVNAYGLAIEAAHGITGEQR